MECNFLRYLGDTFYNTNRLLEDSWSSFIFLNQFNSHDSVFCPYIGREKVSSARGIVDSLRYLYLSSARSFFECTLLRMQFSTLISVLNNKFLSDLTRVLHPILCTSGKCCCISINGRNETQCIPATPPAIIILRLQHDKILSQINSLTGELEPASSLL